MRVPVIVTLAAALSLPVLALPAAQAAEPQPAVAQAGAASASPEAVILHNKKAAAGIVYSIDARGAQVLASGDQLRLSMPAKTAVTWFTDRPQRKAGTVTLAQFESLWSASGFVADPPNAAVIITDTRGDHKHVVEMTDPQVSEGRVSFAMRPVPTATEAGVVHETDPKPGTRGRARVFIDDAAIAPCGKSTPLPRSNTWTGPQPSSTPLTTSQCLLAVGSSVSVGNPNPFGSEGIVVACAVGQPYNPGVDVVTLDRSGTISWAAMPGSVRGCETRSRPPEWCNSAP